MKRLVLMLVLVLLVASAVSLWYFASWYLSGMVLMCDGHWWEGSCPNVVSTYQLLREASEGLVVAAGVVVLASLPVRKFSKWPKAGWFLLGVTLVVAIFLFMLTPSTPPQPYDYASFELRFKWIYAEVLIDEVMLSVSMVTLLVPILQRRIDPILNRRVRLGRPFQLMALLALGAGTFLFAFWVAIDLLGGYGHHGEALSYVLSTYPQLATVYYGVGLNHFQFWDTMGVSGFLSFSVAVSGLVALRANHRVGTAIKDSVVFFAAPVLAAFEFGLWYRIPFDMFWHVVSFTPTSLGRFLTVEQFNALIGQGAYLAWSGNVYLFSNWLVLIVSSGIFILGLANRRHIPPSTNALTGNFADSRSPSLPS